ncbi:hypothetical protein AB0F17_00220 [Nonomuraea sp. NPDC026600]|uniref:hypothetical protein n=1 Tax=Nonomuraea sp. NPDC026600 TaxID=3155363 RepID=UPI0033F39ED9
MNPPQYTLPREVLPKILEISGYLRDFKPPLDDLLRPDVVRELTQEMFELVNYTVVRSTVIRRRREFEANSPNNSNLRLNLQISAADLLAVELERTAETNQHVHTVVKTKRSYQVTEGLFTSRKDLTVRELVLEAGLSQACMNLLGGGLQEYLVELCKLALPPRR